MRTLFLLLSLLFYSLSYSQLFLKKNIDLVGHIDPNPSGGGSSSISNKYSGCWGWYQQSKNKEYAISGASNGTYFIDVTNPSTPSVSAFVGGKTNCIWREIKTYQHYCYIVSDDPVPNRFQIVDMQYLPDSVHVVHDGTQFFERGHTIWIDNDRMYIGLTTFAGSGGYSPMSIFSLATPTAPVLLKRIESDIPNSVINEVHDMYARNDTIYASVGWNGLHFLKFDAANDTLIPLGSYKSYVSAGYNHSSAMTQNGKYMIFCDEVPGSRPIHFIDIQNLANVQPLVSFHPHLETTGHNPYIVGNNFAVVSSYKDGLFIYDISNPNNIKEKGFFDTYPQGGQNINNYGAGPYGGNWGAYPWLPSGIIIANDMQNGVFLLNASKAYTTSESSAVNPVGVREENNFATQLIVYPNPATNRLAVHFNSSNSGILELKNILGEIVYAVNFNDGIETVIDLSSLANGSYFLQVKSETNIQTKKIVISK